MKNFCAIIGFLTVLVTASIAFGDETNFVTSTLDDLGLSPQEIEMVHRHWMVPDRPHCIFIELDQIVCDELTDTMCCRLDRLLQHFFDHQLKPVLIGPCRFDLGTITALQHYGCNE